MYSPMTETMDILLSAERDIVRKINALIMSVTRCADRDLKRGETWYIQGAGTDERWKVLEGSGLFFWVSRGDQTGRGRNFSL